MVKPAVLGGDDDVLLWFDTVVSLSPWSFLFLWDWLKAKPAEAGTTTIPPTTMDATTLPLLDFGGAFRIHFLVTSIVSLSKSNRFENSSLSSCSKTAVRAGCTRSTTAGLVVSTGGEGNLAEAAWALLVPNWSSILAANMNDNSVFLNWMRRNSRNVWRNNRLTFSCENRRPNRKLPRGLLPLGLEHAAASCRSRGEKSRSLDLFVAREARGIEKGDEKELACWRSEWWILPPTSSKGAVGLLSRTGTAVWKENTNGANSEVVTNKTLIDRLQRLIIIIFSSHIIIYSQSLLSSKRQAKVNRIVTPPALAEAERNEWRNLLFGFLSSPVVAPITKLHDDMQCHSSVDKNDRVKFFLNFEFSLWRHPTESVLQMSPELSFVRMHGLVSMTIASSS